MCFCSAKHHIFYVKTSHFKKANLKKLCFIFQLVFLRDEVKKLMLDKKLNSFSLGRRWGRNTHLVSLSDIDSGHNSVTIHKVIIVVINYSPLKYLMEFHYRLLMQGIVTSM